MLEKIGRYELLEEIGQGGFATVYRAHDTVLDRLVALKELKPVLLQDKEWVSRFHHEARTLAQLDHLHVVPIYDVYEIEQRLFIVMRLVNGPSLKQQLSQQGCLSWSEVVKIIGAIAQGLEYAHKRGILHRDLKPANILLDPERGAMLTDFGLAKLIGEASIEVTSAGSMVGTPNYIAPEVWDGKGTTPQSDIYALGCILYEMLTGKQLFKGESPPELMMSHFKPPKLPKRWPAGTPPGMTNLLKTALARQAGGRYASTGELVQALAALQASPPGPMAAEKQRTELGPRIRLFGTVEVEKDGKEIKDFESRKAVALLGYLIRQEQPVSRSRLAGLFWGEKSEQRGRRNLSRELSQLSSRLPDCFEADYHTVQFQPSPACWVDTIAFEALLKQAGLTRLSDSPQSPSDFAGEHAPLSSEEADIDPDKLAEAVAMYRGEFMTGYYLDDCPEFEAWLIREQEGWRRRVTGVLRELAGYYARRGQDDQAELCVRRWLEIEPWQEEAHRYLMILLTRNGNRSSALAQYEICCRTLAEELGAEPETETTTLYRRIQAGEISKRQDQKVTSTNVLRTTSQAPTTATPASAASLSHALPAVRVPSPSAPLVNRTDELAQIGDFLNHPTYRLMTLTGPGGIGKTRLAIEAAWRIAEAAKAGPDEAHGRDSPKFSHGIFFIALDSLSSPEFLVPTLADVLDFSFYSGPEPTAQLLNYLRGKHLLLVLDNFEHLLAASPEKSGADLIGDILDYAPKVKILAVSRERLNLLEEQLLPIQGLSLPTFPNAPVQESNAQVFAIDDKDWGEVRNNSAVQLFVQRAQAVQPGFAPSPEGKYQIVRICRLTEGVPLAIELATSWLRVLSCQEIAQEIKQNLDFLATSLRNIPERQRSLRAVFDYSWQLLSDEEKRVFRQLSVFRGGFTREAAEHVIGASLPLLLAFTDKSLLHRTESGRYERHRLLWQYTASKLDEAPQEKEQVFDCHCDYYGAFLSQQKAALLGGHQKEALAEINAEIENVRNSWQYAIAQGKVKWIEQALESLFHFYDIRSWFHEGAEAFDRAATALSGEDEHGRQGEQSFKASGYPIVLGKLLARRGWFLFQLGQHEPALARLQEGLKLLRHAGIDARRELVFPLNYLGAIHRHLGEYDQAEAYLQESVAICHEMNDLFSAAIALTVLGQVAYLKGEYTQAKQLCEESLTLKWKTGDRRGITFSLNLLGQVAHTSGEYLEAKRFFQESLVISQAIGDDRGVALCLNYLGDVVQMLAEYQGAKQLFQESLTIFKEIGNQWGVISTQIKLGYVAEMLEENAVAKGYFKDALALALEIQAVPLLLDALAGLALLMITEGNSDQEFVLELLALILNHPASSQDTRDRAARLLAELEPQLPVQAQLGQPAKTLEALVVKLL